MHCVRRSRHNLPLSLYVDWKNLHEEAGHAQERLSGEKPMTQLGRMCPGLGVN